MHYMKKCTSFTGHFDITCSGVHMWHYLANEEHVKIVCTQRNR